MTDIVPRPPPSRQAALRNVALSATLLAVAAAAVGWIWQRTPSEPEPQPVGGKGQTREPGAFVRQLAGSARGEGGRGLASGDTVYLGEVITTGAGASLTLATAVGKAHLMLSGESRLTFDTQAEIVAARGRLDVTVPENDMLLSIATPHAQVLARGTGVVLMVDQARTEVQVTQGAAMVKGPNESFSRIEMGARVWLPAGTRD